MDSVIIFGAKYLFVAVVLIFLVILYRLSNRQRRELIVTVIAAMIIAALLDKITGKLYYDPRPFVSQDIVPLINHSPDNGFPSEHTLFSTAIAATIYLYNRRWGMIAVAVAVLVGTSRILAHVHSPIDIIGGLVLGTLAGWLGFYVTKKYLKKELRA